MNHKSTSHRVTHIVGIQWDVAIIYLVRNIAKVICQYVSKVSCMVNCIFCRTMGVLQNYVVISSVIVSKDTIQYIWNDRVPLLLVVPEIHTLVIEI
jgi:hypothetical protein